MKEPYMDKENTTDLLYRLPERPTRVTLELDDMEVMESIRQLAKQQERTIKYIVKTALKDYAKKHLKTA